MPLLSWFQFGQSFGGMIAVGSQPCPKPDCGTTQKKVRGRSSRRESKAKVVRCGFDQFLGFQAEERRASHGTSPAQQRLFFAALTEFVHHGLPGSFDNGWVERGEVGSAKREVQVGSLRCLILRRKNSLGNLDVVCSQTFAGQGLAIYGVETISTTHQSVTSFITRSSLHFES